MKTVYAIQCRCLCGNSRKKGWVQARHNKGPYIYKYRGRAERVARGMAVMWEPDEFRVVVRHIR